MRQSEHKADYFEKVDEVEATSKECLEIMDCSIGGDGWPKRECHEAIHVFVPQEEENALACIELIGHS